MAGAVWDLPFRGSLAGAAITGCSLYFKAKTGWRKQCHLVWGVLGLFYVSLHFMKANPGRL